VYNKDIHIPRTSKCCNVLELFRIFQVPKCQEHSAIDAFIMSCNYPPERHNPKAWANYGCKDTTKFADVQENSEKIAIFWIMDAHEGYGTAFRLLEMGQYSYGTPILIYRVSNVYLSYIYRVSTVVDSGQIADR